MWVWVCNRRVETEEISYACLPGTKEKETYSSAGQKPKKVDEVRVLHGLNETHAT